MPHFIRPPPDGHRTFISRGVLAKPGQIGKPHAKRHSRLRHPGLPEGLDPLSISFKSASSDVLKQAVLHVHEHFDALMAVALRKHSRRYHFASYVRNKAFFRRWAARIASSIPARDSDHEGLPRRLVVSFGNASFPQRGGRVGSRYIWLKKNMPALFKPFNVDCTVIDTSEMYTSQTCSWCGTRLRQTQALMRTKYKTCDICGKTLRRSTVMAAENMIHNAYGNIIHE